MLCIPFVIAHAVNIVTVYSEIFLSLVKLQRHDATYLVIHVIVVIASVIEIVVQAGIERGDRNDIVQYLMTFTYRDNNQVSMPYVILIGKPVVFPFETRISIRLLTK
jgi:hypothetical protein